MLRSRYTDALVLAAVLCFIAPFSSSQNLNALLDEGECVGEIEWGECSINPATGVCERTGSQLSRVEGGERCFQTEQCADELECKASHLLTRKERTKLRKAQRKRDKDARSVASESENESEVEETDEITEPAEAEDGVTNSKRKNKQQKRKNKKQGGGNNEGKKVKRNNGGGKKKNNKQNNGEQNTKKQKKQQKRQEQKQKEKDRKKQQKAKRQDCSYLRTLGECIEGTRTMNVTLVHTNNRTDCKPSRVVTKACDSLVCQYRTTDRGSCDLETGMRTIAQSLNFTIEGANCDQERTIERRCSQKELSRESRDCVYVPGEWTECIEGVVQTQRADSLRDGSHPDCLPSRTIIKECRLGQPVHEKTQAGKKNQREERKRKRNEKRANRKRNRGGKKGELPAEEPVNNEISNIVEPVNLTSESITN